jgi:uncharacterized protein (DUF885 family)
LFYEENERMSRVLQSALGVLLVLISTMHAQTQKKPARPAFPSQWDALVDDFFNHAYFKFHPTDGTAAGFHQYDPLLEDYARAGVDAETATLKTYKTKLESFDSKQLSQEQRDDWQLIENYINSRLLTLEELRFWEKDPDRYSSNISNSIFVIMSRKFAPEDQRLRSVIQRERQIPQVFRAARANLKNPPRIYTQVALMQLPGIISFFQKDVPAAFPHVRSRKLLVEFRSANGAVIEALQQYEKFLKDELLPKSAGDFRIGTENFRKKLLYDEMVDLPLDRLLEIGMADLRKNQRWYKETAAKLDPQRTPEQILEEEGKDHPAPDKLLQTFRDTLGGLKEFIEAKKIITIPSPIPPIVQETPPFARALTFASMDTPGPFEKKAKEAFFNVTLPEKNWKPEEVDEHMAGFNYGTIISTAVHEVYPGHYTQFLWVPQAPSKVRKLLGANSNAEGWAHYCEQMMLDEGYGRGPEPMPGKSEVESKQFLKLRLGQLQDALLRNARFIVGLQMHNGKMTYEEGVDFFIKEGYQSRANAERETRRGTSDPTYLYYTLGKLEILKLRDDYRAKMGSKFSLQEFHDRFIKQGFPPIKMIRRAMLGDESPVL